MKKTRIVAAGTAMMALLAGLLTVFLFIALSAGPEIRNSFSHTNASAVATPWDPHRSNELLPPPVSFQGPSIQGLDSQAALPLRQPGMMTYVTDLALGLIEDSRKILMGLGASIDAPDPRADYHPIPGKEIALYQNATVRKFKRFYLETRRAAFERGLDRAHEFIPMIQSIFREEGLPVDLAYLSVVESNLDPLAWSPKWAAGLWQFMPPTARRFGLRVTPWYDERLDPVLSTRAAAWLLHYLYDRFGEWELALAAYNAGEGRVNRAIRHNRDRGRGVDYWNLPLPLETRRYVPAFLAVAAVYNDLEGHGFAPIRNRQVSRWEAVWGEFYTTLAEIARRIGVGEAELVALNPAWKQQAIPPVQNSEVLLRLPVGFKERLTAAMSGAPFTPPRVLTHIVTAGDTLSHISRQYGVRLSELLRANEIRNRHFLRRGQELVIPLKPAAWKRAAREI
ncbi:MAG: transglycosylase SLT domain-containing protein [SAR324 cluster bacterium]|nr:transglycosylase SLT domain-containing protein [SAR324 cluster bacterium]